MALRVQMDILVNNSDLATKAVILARGLGTRMRKADESATLDAAQDAVADAGVKGMIPIGRPFMDYLISALADAGFTDVCIVIGPEHSVVRDYYSGQVELSRVRIQFAVQEKPLGTADAVLAAEQFAAGDSFVVINSDNYYPVAAFAALHRRRGPAMIAFEARALVELGNVPLDRLARFGSVDIDNEGFLRRVVGSTARNAPAGSDGSDGSRNYASLNCWLFTPEIFRACRDVSPSSRGEYELPQAVQLGIDEHGMRVEVVRMREAVLDMSSRGDIASVTEKLKGVVVRL